MFFPSMAVQCLDVVAILNQRHHATVQPFCRAATFQRQAFAAILAIKLYTAYSREKATVGQPQGTGLRGHAIGDSNVMKGGAWSLMSTL